MSDNAAGQGSWSTLLLKITFLGIVVGVVFGAVGAWLDLGPLAVGLLAGCCIGVLAGIMANRQRNRSVE